MLHLLLLQSFFALLNTLSFLSFLCIYFPPTLLLTLFCQAAEERGVDVKALGAESTLATPTSPCSVTVEHPAERALVFELMQLGDVLHHVLQELLPNRLCDYLKEVHPHQQTPLDVFDQHTHITVMPYLFNTLTNQSTV